MRNNLNLNNKNLFFSGWRFGVFVGAIFGAVGLVSKILFLLKSVLKDESFLVRLSKS